MTKKYIALALAMTLAAGGAMAQKKKQVETTYNGGITTEMMQQMKKSFGGSASDKALRNIMVNQSPAKLAMNYENATKFDTSATAWRAAPSPTSSPRAVAGCSPA